MSQVSKKPARQLADYSPRSRFISKQHCIVTILALVVQTASPAEGLDVTALECRAAHPAESLAIEVSDCQDKDNSIFLWDTASVPAKPEIVLVASDATSSEELDHALFRSVLQDPHYDSESFWARDQRWSEERKMDDADIALVALQSAVDTQLDVRLGHWITFPELPLAFAPLALARGLLLLRRKSPAFEEWTGHIA